MLTQIRKRNGQIVFFQKEKITNAIFKAAQSAGGHDRERAAKLAEQVVELAEKQFGNIIPSVEDIQDIVEKVLIENGHAKTAKAYILWRDKRAQVRRYRAILGIEDDLKFPLNTLMVLGARYLRRDENRNITETPRQMFERVSKTLANVDRNYGATNEDVAKIEKDFFEMMVKRYFMPNSPTLMNAGTELGQLSACVTGDTIIHTCAGDFSIKDLAEKYKERPNDRFDVYSVTSFSELGIGKAFYPRLTQRNAPVYKITFDDGSSLKATDNHLVMFRNGKFTPVSKLAKGQSVMPFNHDWNHGYLIVFAGIDKYPIAAHKLVYEKISGNKLDSSEVIHHKNYNKKDNSFGNLEVMDKTGHFLWHSEHLSMYNPMYTEEARLKVSLYMKNNNPMKKKEISMKVGEKNKLSLIGNHNAPIIPREIRECIKCGKEFQIKITSSKTHCSKKCAALDNIPKNRSWKGEMNPNYGTKKFSGTPWWAKPNPIHPRTGLPIDNHKVISIEFVGYEDVYDLSVEKYNNFAANNIFVHNCFVLPVDDDIWSIFEAVKYQAVIHKTGGGTGFSFSRLRPRNDVVKKTGGIASGPVTFMQIFDKATDVIKQGGKRRGANMGILRVDHPDILDFIVMKERENIMTNFNISVAVTDKFMKAVMEDKDYDLLNPRTKKTQGKLNARAVWNLIVTMAWKTGDPGVIFIDKINASESNPVPAIGPVESTNPCGEQPLYSYDSCNLGSINLGAFVVDEDGKKIIDWTKMQEIIRKSVHFLDNVIDANKYPIPQIEEMSKRIRRIGLGVMGWADMLILLGIPYNSEQALRLAETVMNFISAEGRKMSVELGLKRGSFPEFERSIWKQRGYPAMRNSTVTTIAPTGTISIIAECSQGIEPHFAIAYMRNVGESLGTGENLIEITPVFEKTAIEEGFYSEDLMKKILKSWSIQNIEEIPEKIRRVFVTAHDITPDWHVRHQATFQKHTDNAVSKTINFPVFATPHDVEKTYMAAYQTGCKGITIFRDQSKTTQVITLAQPIEQKNPESEPETIQHVPAFNPPMIAKSDGGNITVDEFYTGDVNCPECHV